MGQGKGVVIAISGPPGSGKTTYASRLARELGLRYHSAGKIFRDIARERGLTLDELSSLAEKDPRIDVEIDRRTLEEALRGDVVLEGHLVAWVVKEIADVKIYVTAPLMERVKRIASREGRDFMEVLAETAARELSQARRFYSYYGIDTRDLSIYDLVVDTSKLTIDETYHIIKSFVKSVIGERRVGAGPEERKLYQRQQEPRSCQGAYGVLRYASD